MVRFEKTWTDFKYDELATFLFTTREGGRGIVQVFPKDQDTDRYRLRYRMWLTARARPARRRRRSPDRSPSLAGRNRLEHHSQKSSRRRWNYRHEGREFLLDLETGRKAVPPKIAEAPTRLRTRRPSPGMNNSPDGVGIKESTCSATWTRHGPRPPAGALAKARRKAAEPESHLSLIGLDMIEARILPQSFDELTVEDAREILERMPEKKSATAWMMIDAQLAERPDTFAFRTREGTVGLLQMEAAEKEAGKLTIRYRLEAATDRRVGSSQRVYEGRS